MSDVSDVIQILELNFRIGKGITKSIINLYKNLYYGQWSGQASYRKFQKIAGSNTAYLEIKTENEKALENVKKYLFDRFRLLYCELPDLQPGDSRTQFILNSEQAESIKAGLNNYNYERLKRLKEASEKYGRDTEEYLKAKSEIEEEFPEVRSITADDYVMSALDEDGNKSKEYQDLEESADQAIREEEEKKKAGQRKTKGKTDPASDSPSEEKTGPASDSPSEEKTGPVSDSPAEGKTEGPDKEPVSFTDTKKKTDYESLIKNGEAQYLKVADVKMEYAPAGGKKKAFFHIDIGNGESAVLPGSSLINKDTAVLLNKKTYTVVNRATKKITKKTGKEISEAMKALKVVKGIAKGVKAASKTAMMTNPVTGAISIAKDILTLGVRLAIKQIKRTKERQRKAVSFDPDEMQR